MAGQMILFINDLELKVEQLDANFLVGTRLFRLLEARRSGIWIANRLSKCKMVSTSGGKNPNFTYMLMDSDLEMTD